MARRGSQVGKATNRPVEALCLGGVAGQREIYRRERSLGRTANRKPGWVFQQLIPAVRGAGKQALLCRRSAVGSGGAVFRHPEEASGDTVPLSLAASDSSVVMPVTRLRFFGRTGVTTHPGARSVEDREQHFVPALMLLGAAIT